MSSYMDQHSMIDEAVMKFVDQKFKLVKLIGDGLQSKVYLVENLEEISDGSDSDTIIPEMPVKQYAMKIFDKEELKHLGQQEFNIMKQLEGHPSVLKVQSFFSDGNLTERLKDDSPSSKEKNVLKGFDYMTMDYCSNGDLFEIVKKTGKLQPRFAKYLFLQLLDAIEHLHLKSTMAHLDLKLENILIGNDYKLKLCDFGFSEDINQLVKKNKGTDGYKAPEIYLKHKTGFEGDKADIFALGVILFIMEFGVPPFTAATKDNHYYRIFYRGSNASRFFFRLHPATKDSYQKGELDPELSELLLALMEENPQLRPQSVKEIKSYSYLQGDIMTEEEAVQEIKKRLESL